MSSPHTDLVPLLSKYDISWEMFTKKGRPPKGVREKRSSIVTELHSRGLPWKKMFEITGLTNGAIQGLTKAMWNSESRKNSQENGVRTGKTWKGKKRPGQLDRQWAKGDYESLKGRVRSEEECQKLRDGWTPGKRAMRSLVKTLHWMDPQYRKGLLDFHRSPEERARRSVAQAKRIQEDPVKWARGKGQYVNTTKCSNGGRIWVRSTYEVAAVGLLEADPLVGSYDYESRFVLEDGKAIVPDFLVTYQNGEKHLIEVKASWVFKLPPDDKISIRLEKSHKLAMVNQWPFHIWTEKDDLQDALRKSA